MLSCKDLIETVKTSFTAIKENKKRHRPISLIDTLMSGYALFSLKYPSLLQFDRHHREDMISHNLEHIYGIKDVPSDTQMRERLDKIEPTLLRPTYRRLFAQCQRSKHLELFKYYENRYLMTLAFFVDQLQQLGCKLFKKALVRLHTKRSLWERKRALFFDFFINSIEDLWSALAFGHKASLVPNSS